MPIGVTVSCDCPWQSVRFEFTRQRAIVMFQPRPAAEGDVAESGCVPDLQAAPRATRQGFLDWIDRAEFPCVGAKAALAREAITTAMLGTLGDASGDRALHAAITAFGVRIAGRDADDTTVYSMAAMFTGPTALGEHDFEARLWAQLQRLHDLDVAAGVPWADRVGTDPDSAAFSLAIGGHAFFVIGLHPGASRRARRFPTPVLVFNSHAQFEELRANGTYQKMQQATRARDIALQGSINPNLADFGTAPETRQYSGRRVEPDWRCPFRVAPASQA